MQNDSNKRTSKEDNSFVDGLIALGWVEKDGLLIAPYPSELHLKERKVETYVSRVKNFFNKRFARR